ncbi:MAG: helix-turn-helix transcriptional regulator [Clostridiales Family XIII bacterium]|jgi:transcriptional regulator with XRE-family HTH domain|nr:helix-turn-helix transcriptional regulator [Clostridiales Family XIII bacterium]
MSDTQIKIGKRIREFRNAKTYSIEELAHIAGLNAVHLASLERGEKNATLATLEKVVEALGISFGMLFAFGDEIIRSQGEPLDDKIIAMVGTLSQKEKQFVYESALFISKNRTGGGD